MLLVNLGLRDDVVQRLVGVELHPLNRLGILELRAHLGNLRVLLLVPDVVSLRSLESVELLGFEANAYHQQMLVVHFSELGDRAVVETSTVADSVAVLHEAHKWDYEHLGEYLFLIFSRLKDIEQMRLDEIIAPAVLAENKRNLLLYNDRQRMVQIVFGIL